MTKRVRWLEEGGDDFAGATVVTEFAQVDSLPGAEVEAPVCDWNLDT